MHGDILDANSTNKLIDQSVKDAIDNSVDVTDIETADITKLRTIVINLIDALSTSGLIRQNSNLE